MFCESVGIYPVYVCIISLFSDIHRVCPYAVYSTIILREPVLAEKAGE